MIDALIHYGLFLAKTMTLVVAILVIISAIASLALRGKKERGQLKVKKLNDNYQEMEETLRFEIGNKQEIKDAAKKAKELEKATEKANEDKKRKKRVFVVRFDGDLRAHAVESLREEITAILTVATAEDEVVVCLESPGGVVHGYGLAASQLARVKAKGLPLTAVIDKVAASGGYLMAVVADKVVAAPFAIIGSIGVAVELPNFNRLLKQHHIDYEQITGGEYKRTLSVLGENTSKGRAKMLQEVEDTHGLFKQFVHLHRPFLNIDQVATGEYWLAQKAIEYKLVDALSTSDDYLYDAAKIADVFEISFAPKQSFGEKFLGGVSSLLTRLIRKNSEVMLLKN